MGFEPCREHLLRQVNGLDRSLPSFFLGFGLEPCLDKNSCSR
jgi:hypothetical protein